MHVLFDGARGYYTGRKERRMRYIIAGILVGIVVVVFLYPYFSNCGIPGAIDELTKEVEKLTKEVRELRKTIEERSEDEHTVERL